MASLLEEYHQLQFTNAKFTSNHIRVLVKLSEGGGFCYEALNLLGRLFSGSYCRQLSHIVVILV